MYELKVIGVRGTGLAEDQNKELADCCMIVTSRRHRPLTEHLAIPRRDITPLAEGLQSIREGLKAGNVAVLASGDPLFYGIGTRLLKEFPGHRLHFSPAVTSIQEASSHFGIPWDDAALISLHGRQPHHLPGLLLGQRKSFILTDNNSSPDTIAEELLAYLDRIDHPTLASSIRMMVGENLGLVDQKLHDTTLMAIAATRFAPLNVICLLVPDSDGTANWCFGLGESDIEHSRGLITKNEVRAASLHSLCLPRSGVFWDIGAGSGSVALEAARLCPRLRVYAIEKNQEQLDNIKKNIVRYGCFNIEPISGEAPEALAHLPQPDRIFIGGSGGRLAAIIGAAVNSLNPDGRLVVNAVLATTREQAPAYLHEHGCRVHTTTIQVSRYDDDGGTQQFNPITIITGIR